MLASMTDQFRSFLREFLDSGYLTRLDGLHHIDGYEDQRRHTYLWAQPPPDWVQKTIALDTEHGAPN